MDRAAKTARDKAMLSVPLGCDLRRSEAASLTFEHVQIRESRWVIADITGKGNRRRTAPMSAWARNALDPWAAKAGTSQGRVFRSLNCGGRLTGDGMTDQAIADVVKEYAPKGIAAHDWRRTFAKLAHKGNAGLDQIQLSLGHSSIQTTERYLGVSQNRTDAPCDQLG